MAHPPSPDSCASLTHANSPKQTYKHNRFDRELASVGRHTVVEQQPEEGGPRQQQLVQADPAASPYQAHGIAVSCAEYIAVCFAAYWSAGLQRLAIVASSTQRVLSKIEQATVAN